MSIDIIQLKINTTMKTIKNDPKEKERAHYKIAFDALYNAMNNIDFTEKWQNPFFYHMAKPPQKNEQDILTLNEDDFQEYILNAARYRIIAQSRETSKISIKNADFYIDTVDENITIKVNVHQNKNLSSEQKKALFVEGCFNASAGYERLTPKNEVRIGGNLIKNLLYRTENQKKALVERAKKLKINDAEKLSVYDINENSSYAMKPFIPSKLIHYRALNAIISIVDKRMKNKSLEQIIELQSRVLTEETIPLHFTESEFCDAFGLKKNGNYFHGRDREHAITSLIELTTYLFDIVYETEINNQKQLIVRHNKQLLQLDETKLRKVDGKYNLNIHPILIDQMTRYFARISTTVFNKKISDERESVYLELFKYWIASNRLNNYKHEIDGQITFHTKLKTIAEILGMNNLIKLRKWKQIEETVLKYCLLYYGKGELINYNLDQSKRTAERVLEITIAS